MANVLPFRKQVEVVKCLVNGVSIRGTERMENVHRDTIMRLVVTVGEGCQRFHNAAVFDVPVNRLECDEIWSFVYKKQGRLVEGIDDFERMGEIWTWTAIDPVTKFIPSYWVSKQTTANAMAFVRDIKNRIAYTDGVQISTDGLKAYRPAIEEAFGADAHFTQIVKFFESEPVGPGRYGPPKVNGMDKRVRSGNPDLSLANTTYVECHNRTIRTFTERMTRLTPAFSKKWENHKAAMALYFMYYNFCWTPRTTRVSPAMAAGVCDQLLEVEDLVDLALVA